MALDIDSLLELELQHTEDTEQHMDLTPTELEPAASDPADSGPHNAPPTPPCPASGRPGHTCPTPYGATTPPTKPARAPAEYRASLEHDLPDVTGPGLHGPRTPTWSLVSS